ncbi:hypothetical protein ABZ092_36235 [Streptomyces bobili]|uniref:hypothetical protein n=1 Tax=Streptomyces bobili TaxID=67280 RepID=UPI0033A26AAA
MPTTYYPYDNGTVGPTGPEGPQGPPGSPGTPGVVQSVNGQSAQAVVLAATDVGALPSNANATLDATYLSVNRPAGNYRVVRWLTSGVSRWEAQADDVAETGSAAGSDFRLASRNDDGSFNKTVVHAKRSDGTISFGTTTHHGSAQVTSYGSLGLRDVGTDPATTSGGVFLYSKSGKMFVKQADGTSFQIAQVSYPVSSVNGQTGTVTLGASDVGALPLASGGEVNGTIALNGAAGTYRELSFNTSGTKRWSVQADNTAEGPGTDDGSNFRIISRDDAGNFKATHFYANRDTGQMVFGDGAKVGGAKATTAGPHGFRNITWEPETDATGFQIYAKDGLPYIKQGDGTIFKVGSGGGGTGGAVDSVNGKTGVVSLTADDVNALPTTGGTLTGPLNITPPSGNGLTVYGGSDPATYFRVTEAGHPYSNSLRATFYNMGIGDTTTDFGGGKFALGFKNASVVPTTNPVNGVVAYSEAGVLKVRQTNGTVVTVANAPVSSVNGATGAVNLTVEDLDGVSVSDVGQANGLATLDSGKRVPLAQIPLAATPGTFIPEDLGLKAWAGDPATCRSGYRDGSTGKGRMAAVVVRQTTTVSKIVWHFLGYAGGMKTGSWAGIYNTSGTLVRGTGDLSTAAYEPAEQHGVGGGCSSSNLTSSVTLAPGTYYIAWRFNYTASPADGPLLMAFESTDVSATLYGLNAVRRFGAFATSASTAPSSVSGWETDPIRFWVALA